MVTNNSPNFHAVLFASSLDSLTHLLRISKLLATPIFLSFFSFYLKSLTLSFADEEVVPLKRKTPDETALTGESKKLKSGIQTWA
jgi:hypothetical protein